MANSDSEADIWTRLPSSAPRAAGDAFRYINSVRKPTPDDLKLMVYLEVYGFDAYMQLAEAAPNSEVRRLLEASASEELIHAHRVAVAIQSLTGESFDVPEPDQNPYVEKLNWHVDRDMLHQRANSEANGGRLYETWALNIGEPEVSELFRLNGEEENGHSARMLQAAAALEK